MLGVIEEQHPERARLFLQWKQMGWPLLVDSLNLLEVPVVPITLLVDEQGRARRAPRLRNPEAIEKAVRGVLAEEPSEEGSVEEGEPVRSGREPDALPQRAVAVPLRPEGDDAAAWRDYGRRLFLTRGPAGLDDAIASYEKALELEAEDPGGWAHFRLGVLYRARYDSSGRREGDFQTAVDLWQAALDRDPNNYIFRRRIQQYGPRLDKPYPFYDWVETARSEVRARGVEPVELAVLPGGAELADPAERGGAKAATPPAQPDPKGRILRDPGELVTVEATVVPDTARPEGPRQIHLAFRPVEPRKVHWNNEAEGLTVWLDAADGARVTPHRTMVPNPPETLSRETRRLDFEVQSSEPARGSERSGDEALTLSGYALYYVCEDIDGTCLYRRQDLTVEVR